MSPKLKIDSLPRADGVSDRVVLLSLAARFMDELLSGLPTVLMPTIRAQFGLSYTQVSLLGLALSYAAAIIEPINGLLIDLWKRPWLMAFGAAGIGLGTAVIGLAPTLAILLPGFAIYGLASGPLAHTADVVLVEAYPKAPDRIYTRATLLDTVGALLAPLSVTISIWMGLNWRWLLICLGLSSFVYAVLILRTRFPCRSESDERGHQGFGIALRENLRAVLSSKRAMTWLLYLLAFSVLEAPLQFTTIWLREQVGMSQALIGIYVAIEMGVSIVSLVYLDRWLARSSSRRILLTACLGLLILYPAWVVMPGIAMRFLLALPLGFLEAVLWPIGKAQSLASVPGRGGTVTAVQSLMGLIPIPLLFGLLAETVTLTTAMLWVLVGATISLILIVWFMPSNVDEELSVG